MRTLQVFAKSCEATCRSVERSDVITRRGKLHRLAAGRRAEVEDDPCVGRYQARGKRGGKVLNPPAAFAKPREISDRRALKADVIWSERGAAMLEGVGLRLNSVGKGQIERRTGRDLP